ncbi:hypothetical protein ACFZBU_38535 [Embleya sp. NPDC008237]|uniref:hypothetical protein n=1 Tax=Embleya sp. NPDC008237 TaxID=3363978 RepID=UPI0036E921DE
MLSAVNADGTTETGFLIDDIVREGARRTPAAALETEVNTYMAELADQRDEHGHRLVVRAGAHFERDALVEREPATQPDVPYTQMP